MTARVSQAHNLVLVEEDSKARVSQAFFQILWGLDSAARVAQAHQLILYRRRPRRVVAMTD